MWTVVALAKAQHQDTLGQDQAEDPGEEDGEFAYDNSLGEPPWSFGG